jgi:hypothetical protein
MTSLFRVAFLELLEFLSVVLPVKNVPLQTSLRNTLLLRLYLFPRIAIECFFSLELLVDDLCDFKSDGIAILDKLNRIVGYQILVTQLVC